MVRRLGWLLCSLLVIGCGGRLAEDAPSDGGDEVENERENERDTGDGYERFDTAGPPDTFAPPPDTFGPPPDTFGPVADVSPPPTARQFVVLHAATDRPGALYCIAAFLASADVATADKPLTSAQPIGLPDPTSPFDPARRRPLRWGDAVTTPMTDSMEAALDSFSVVVWSVATNPLAVGRTCSDTWSEVRSDRSRYHLIPKGTVPSGRSFVVAGEGCSSPSDAGGCGSSSSEFSMSLLADAPPAVVDGGTPGISLEAIDWSRWRGLPSRDVYLAGGPDSWTSLGRSSSYGVVTPARATEAFSLASARFVLLPGGTFARCFNSAGKPTDACPAWSPFVSPISTVTNGAPSPGTNFTLVWIGSPAIESGPGSLRAIWIRTR